MINQLSLSDFTDPIFALSDVQSQELLKYALSNPLYSIVTVVLLIIGLLIGWKIYPYTIGGFDAFATSALGHLQARMATATFGGLVGAGLGIYLLVVKIDKESTPSKKLAAIESEQAELRNDVRNSDNPASATSEQKTKMRELEARKEELRLKKAEVDRLAASNLPTPRTKTNSQKPAAPAVNKVGSTETSAESYVLEKHMEAGVKKFFDILSTEKPLDKTFQLFPVEEFAATTLELWKKNLAFPKDTEAKLKRNEPVRTQEEFNAHVKKYLWPESTELRKAFSNYFCNREVAEAEKEVVFMLLVYIVKEGDKD